MAAYYNENDKKTADWLRQLIRAGLIANGDIDDRSIEEVTAEDIIGYTQHHFFAGIGGWSYALRLAGLDDKEKVCTASLPCQPFSVAGKQEGEKDLRNLLPCFLNLIKDIKPKIIFGEQVENAVKHGWSESLQTGLEREGYAVRFEVLGAHSAGAPHIRQRLYWMGYANSIGWQKRGKNATAQRSGEAINSTDWGDVQWVGGKDGRFRPIKSSLVPVVNGVSERMVRSGHFSEQIEADQSGEAVPLRLKGYGNAIVPQVAAMFIRRNLCT